MDDRTKMMGEQQPTVLGGTPTQMGASRTMMGANRTQMGVDPMRTQMGAPSTTALQVECLPGNPYAFWQGSPRNHVLVNLRSTGQQIGRRTPLNICLAIDRSGSMEGPPLEYVKQACEYVVDMLEPNDILSIVTFEENVDVLMSARKVVNKPLVKEHIRRIYVGNTTNLYDGMMSSCLQLTTVMAQAQGYIHRVLLLTDGEPTSGLRDYNSIVQQVGEQKKRGITITALGFGSEYNEELMAGIARRSGGNYYHIQRPDLIPEVFRREMESLMTLVAKNIRLRIHLPRWVNLRQVYGLQPSTMGNIIDVSLTDIERGTTRSVLAELDFERHPQGVFRIAKIEVHYDDLLSNTPQSALLDSLCEFTKDRDLIQANYNPTVQAELEVAHASMNLQRTMMGMKTQQLTAMGAMGELEKTRTMLAQAGRTLQANELTQAMQSLQQGGGDVEKTLIGAIYNLDQGKRQ